MDRSIAVLLMMMLLYTSLSQQLNEECDGGKSPLKRNVFFAQRDKKEFTI